jgi:hypothetical protein
LLEPGVVARHRKQLELGRRALSAKRRDQSRQVFLRIGCPRLGRDKDMSKCSPAHKIRARVREHAEAQQHRTVIDRNSGQRFPVNSLKLDDRVLRWRSRNFCAPRKLGLGPQRGFK